MCRASWNSRLLGLYSRSSCDVFKHQNRILDAITNWILLLIHEYNSNQTEITIQDPKKLFRTGSWLPTCPVWGFPYIYIKEVKNLYGSGWLGIRTYVACFISGFLMPSNLFHSKLATTCHCWQPCNSDAMSYGNVATLSNGFCESGNPAALNKAARVDNLAVIELDCVLLWQHWIAWRRSADDEDRRSEPGWRMGKIERTPMMEGKKG